MTYSHTIRVKDSDIIFRFTNTEMFTINCNYKYVDDLGNIFDAIKYNLIEDSNSNSYNNIHYIAIPKSKLTKFDKGKVYLKKLIDSVNNSNTTKPVKLVEEDISKQYKQWELCSILEQCLLDPLKINNKNKNNGLPLIYLSTNEKFLLFRALYYYLPLEGYSFLLENIGSSEILDEMQIYGRNVILSKIKDTDNLNVTDIQVPCFNNICSSTKNNTIGHYDMCSNYLLQEYSYHPRGLVNKFIKIYGDINSKNYGFRYSGHHFDINIQINNNKINVLPVFRGYMPIIVPDGPHIDQSHHKHATFTSFWSQNSGIDRSPMVNIAIEQLTVDLSNIQNKHIQLNSDIATGIADNDGFIGMTVLGQKSFLPKNIKNRNIHTFNDEQKTHIWNLVKTSLDIVTNNYESIKHDIINNGEFGWSYFPTVEFTYFRIETDKYLSQSMLGKEYSVQPIKSRGVHYHSRFCEKREDNIPICR